MSFPGLLAIEQAVTCHRASSHLPSGKQSLAIGQAVTCHRASSHLPSGKQSLAIGQAVTCLRASSHLPSGKQSLAYGQAVTFSEQLKLCTDEKHQKAESGKQVRKFNNLRKRGNTKRFWEAWCLRALRRERERERLYLNRQWRWQYSPTLDMSVVIGENDRMYEWGIVHGCHSNKIFEEKKLVWIIMKTSHAVVSGWNLTCSEFGYRVQRKISGGSIYTEVNYQFPTGSTGKADLVLLIFNGLSLSPLRDMHDRNVYTQKHGGMCHLFLVEEKCLCIRYVQNNNSLCN